MRNKKPYNPSIYPDAPPVEFNPEYDPEVNKWWPLYTEKIREIHEAFRAAGITRQDTADYLHDNGWLTVFHDEAISELRAQGLYHDLKITHREKVLTHWGIN